MGSFASLNLMEVMLCNPVLQEFKLVPGSKTRVNNFSCGGIGFGYDSRTKNYKLVRLHEYCTEAGDEVRILGSNSWRQINVSQDVRITDQYQYLHWKGDCYWQVQDHMAELLEWEILCFDMADEIFYSVSFLTNELDIASFPVWNDSFALFLCTQEISENSDLTSYEMWNMLKGCSPTTLIPKSLGILGWLGLCIICQFVSLSTSRAWFLSKDEKTLYVEKMEKIKQKKNTTDEVISREMLLLKGAPVCFFVPVNLVYLTLIKSCVKAVLS
ncbi:uncharacterized protein LOC21394780 [Morus notabilis]|nr:uncharacterized protein LOC21394780 [Morus notabilis]